MLYDLKERLSYDPYIASSPPVRLRLAAGGRPVGLSTRLAFLSTTTTVGIELVTNISNSYLDCDGH